MHSITIDSNLAEKLASLTGPVELCDPAGRVFGRFLPQVDLARWESSAPPGREEELERIANSGGRRYTTAEVLAHLEKL